MGVDSGSGGRGRLAGWWAFVARSKEREDCQHSNVSQELHVGFGLELVAKKTVGMTV